MGVAYGKEAHGVACVVPRDPAAVGLPFAVGECLSRRCDVVVYIM